MQTKRQSWVETSTNTGIGFLGSWLITLACLHLLTDMVVIATTTTVLCTIWSLVRGYLVRRYFNRLNHVHRN